MYALALLVSAGAAAATTSLPYFHLGALDIGIPIQWFGMIVAAGVLFGSTVLRRYGEWHGVSDDHVRGLLTWVMVAGFLGAHEFDMVAYQWDKFNEWFTPSAGGIHALWPPNWPLVLRIWDGISSYGGFIGGAIGFWLYVWWKRLPMRLFADVTIVGLLPAFSIGRIGCTVVSDHVGAAVDPGRWYAFLAMDYPRNFAHLGEVYPGTSEFIRAWNLGLIEFLYLVPVNVVVLALAFRPAHRKGDGFVDRLPAGFLTVLTALLYAPVRFFLDFLRPESTDPRYFGLTFAQWSSILAFGGALYVASRIFKTGAPAEPVTRTAREAQERLRIVLREDEEAHKKQASDRKAEAQREAERKQAEIARLRAERDREDAEIEAAERAAAETGKPADAGATEADKPGAGATDAGEAEAPAGGKAPGKPPGKAKKR